MKSHGLEPIPEETRQLVERLSPKGTMVTQLRDALGPIYSDESSLICSPHADAPPKPHGAWRW